MTFLWPITQAVFQGIQVIIFENIYRCTSVNTTHLDWNLFKYFHCSAATNAAAAVLQVN